VGGDEAEVLAELFMWPCCSPPPPATGTPTPPSLEPAKHVTYQVSSDARTHSRTRRPGSPCTPNSIACSEKSLTPQSRVFLEKLIVAHSFKKFPPCMEPYGSLLCSQEPTYFEKFSACWEKMFKCDF